MKPEHFPPRNQHVPRNMSLRTRQSKANHAQYIVVFLRCRRREAGWLYYGP